MEKVPSKELVFNKIIPPCTKECKNIILKTPPCTKECKNEIKNQNMPVQ